MIKAPIKLSEVPSQVKEARKKDLYPQFFFLNKEKTSWHLGLGLHEDLSPLSFFIPSFWDEPKPLNPAYCWSEGAFFQGKNPLSSSILPMDVNEPQETKWEDFFKVFETFKQSVSNKKLKKIVLARQKIYQETFSDIASLLEKLLKRTEASFIYYFAPNKDEYFICNSPERLFKRENNELIIDVIAGTRPRGKTKEEDKQLENELLSSKKDEEEQSLVEKELLVNIEVLSPLSLKDLKNCASSPKLLKLDKLMHIQNELRVPLKEDLHPEELLKALHPTAAVGGAPKKEALTFLKEYETPLFKRSFYAAPCGYASPQNGEADFCVGIRSAHVNLKKGLTILTAGAGIMPESDPKEEWLEMEKKLGHMESLLFPHNHDHDHDHPNIENKGVNL